MSSFDFSLVLVFISWILLSNGSNSFDPDLDICDKSQTNIDSSVNSVDGSSYILKGEYYWKTSPLDFQSGIIGYADLIRNKWPEIDEPIIASFTFKYQTSFTVFVSKNKWFAYENGGRVTNGSTEKWPDFQKLDINTMFSIDSEKNQIFVIHNNSYSFLIYEFKAIANPLLNISGITSVTANYLWFIDSPSDREDTTLKDIMEVKNSITYSHTLILMSSTKYCKIDLKALIFEKECLPNELIYTLLNCPLDLNGRPTTATSIGTTLVSSSIEDKTTVIGNQSTRQPSGPPIDTTTRKPSNQSVNPNQVVEENNTSSFIIFAVIIGIVVVIAGAIIIGLVFLLWTKKSNESNPNMRMGSRRSISSSNKVLSNSGSSIRSKSIESLREANERN